MKFFILLLITSSISFRNQSLVIDGPSIARKTLPEVERVLGNCIKVEQFKPTNSNCLCERHYFLDNQVSIVFINQKADWITAKTSIELANVEEMKCMAFHKSSNEVRIILTVMKHDGCCLPL